MKRNSRRNLLVTAACTSLLVAALMLPMPAIADTASSLSAGSTPTVTSAITGSELDKAQADPATAKKRDSAEDQLMESSAANGVLYDADDVQSSVVNNTAVAWSESVDLAKVMVTSTGKQIEGIGTVGSNSADDTDVTMADMGSKGLTGKSGTVGDPAGGTVQVTNSGFKLESGWERYQLKESKSDRDVYYYGHWATAVGKSVTGYDPAPYAVEVRSRPKSGTRSTFLQLRDYWPKSGSNVCGSGASVSVSVLVFSASLPMQNCSSVSPDPDANSITMKVSWSAGTCKDSTTEGTDLGMAVDTKPGDKAILSDYSYARFDTAKALCNGGTSDDVRVIYADPGW